MKTQLRIAALLLAMSFGLNAQIPGAWTPVFSGFSPLYRYVATMSSPNSQVIWGIGRDGAGNGDKLHDYTRSIDGGLTFTEGRVPLTAAQDSADLEPGHICALNKDTAYIIMYSEMQTVAGDVWRTTDGGQNWTKLNVPFTANSFPNVVHFFNYMDGVAMGDPLGGYFEIYTTNDGGQTWVRTPNTGNVLNPSVSSEYGIVDMYDVVADTIWFGTNKGRVFKSKDKGLTWTVATTGLTEVSEIRMRDANNGLVVQKLRNASNQLIGTTMRRTIDGGATWTAVTKTGAFFPSAMDYVPGTPSTWISVGSYLPTNSTAAVLYKSGSGYSNDDGVTWQLIDSGNNPVNQQKVSVIFNSPTQGFAGTFVNQAGIDGIFKWAGPALSIPTSNSNVESAVAVYPNPAHNEVAVALRGMSGKSVEISIFNVVGQKVLSVTNDYISNLFIRHIDISGLDAGMYIINVNDGEKAWSSKVYKN